MPRKKSDGMGEADFGPGQTPNAERDIDDRFADFHRDNPKVYELFKVHALHLYNMGFRKYSADAILHVMKWRHDVKHKPENGRSTFYKVNDHYTSRYAQLLAEEDERFVKFFPRKRRTRR